MERALKRRDDLALKVGRWEPSEEKPWPDLTVILQNRIFKAPEYESLRQRLTRPTPQPTLQDKGDFWTVDSTNMDSRGQARLSGPPSGDDEEQAEESGPAAGGTDRDGLVHFFPFGTTTALPKQLATIALKLLVIEIPKEHTVFVQ